MSKDKGQKNSKRSRAKYPALDITYMPRSRKEYMDIDYLDKLNDEEKAWLNKFMDETLNASFRNNENDLIQDTKKKRKIYNENNARNRCMYSIAKARGYVVDSDKVLSSLGINELFDEYEEESESAIEDNLFWDDPEAENINEEEES